ncbi:MAG: hypothetical protein HC828_20885 [Blastochloris sp.]|nr:hypothetical protein [Blastochloris sp.]
MPRLQSLRSGVPAAYQEVLDRALAKDPARRYAHARDLARDVNDIVSGKWLLRRL